MVAQEPQLDWAIDMYVVASSVAHQLLPDRIMRNIGFQQAMAGAFDDTSAARRGS